MARAAHSSVMAMLVSYGFVGAGLYLMLDGWSAKQLFRPRWIAEADRDPALGIFAAMSGAVLASVFVSGIFSNCVFAAVQIWVIGVIAAVVNLPEAREPSGVRQPGPDEPFGRRRTHRPKPGYG